MPAADVERPRDAGMTLAELLVTIGLLAVLTTMLSTLAILSTRTVDTMSTRVDDSSRGDVAMSNISKLVRTAVLPAQLAQGSCTTCATTALVSASSSKLVFYANLETTGGGPRRITLEVVSDTDRNDGTGLLRVTTQTPIAATGGYSFCDPAQTTCAAVRRSVARGLLWPSPTVFRYVDVDGAILSGPTVSAANLGRVSSIDVTLAVRSRSDSRYATSTTVSRISMPNIDMNLRSGA